MATTNPPIRDLITIKEGVALLSDTGHPVTPKQLARWLAGAPRERHGVTYYYSASDVLVAHRDHIERTLR